MNSCAKNGGAPRRRFSAIGEKPEGGCSNTTPPARRGLNDPHSCRPDHSPYPTRRRTPMTVEGLGDVTVGSLRLPSRAYGPQ